MRAHLSLDSRPNGPVAARSSQNWQGLRAGLADPLPRSPSAIHCEHWPRVAGAASTTNMQTNFAVRGYTQNNWFARTPAIIGRCPMNPQHRTSGCNASCLARVVSISRGCGICATYRGRYPHLSAWATRLRRPRTSQRRRKLRQCVQSSRINVLTAVGAPLAEQVFELNLAILLSQRDQRIDVCVVDFLSATAAPQRCEDSLNILPLRRGGR